MRNGKLGAFLPPEGGKNRAIRFNLFCPAGKKGFPLLSLAHPGEISNGEK
jgi:hypothetical protein